MGSTGRSSFICGASISLRRPQESPRVNVRQSRNHLLVADAEMHVPAKELFHDEIVEELHVGGRETYRGIDALVQGFLALQVVKSKRKPASQFLRDVLKHLAKVPIFKFENVDIHQQPKIVMVIYHLLDQPRELGQVVAA